MARLATESMQSFATYRVIVKVDHFAAELGRCPHLRRHLRRPRVVEVRLAVVEEAVGPEVNLINILQAAFTGADPKSAN